VGSARELAGSGRAAAAPAHQVVRARAGGAAGRGPERRKVLIRFGAGLVALTGATLLATLFTLAVLPAFLPGWSTVAVGSASMEPALKVGDVVVVSAPQAVDRIATGTVILIDDPSRDVPLLHRVVGADPEGYTTRGDANPSADSAPVPPDSVIGVGRMVVPTAGWPMLWSSEGVLGPLAAMTVALVGLLAVARFAWSDRYDPWSPERVEVRVVPRSGSGRGLRSGRHRVPQASDARPVPRLRREVRLGALGAAVLVGAVLGSLAIQPASAAFSGTTKNVANSVGTGSVAPPTNLAASKTCPTAGPSYVTGVSGTASTTAFTVTVPSGVAAGDLLVVHLVVDTATVSTPAGWTLFRADAQAGLGGAFIYQRLAGAGEAGLTYTWTYTASGGGGRLHAFRSLEGPIGASYGVDWSLAGASGGAYTSISSASVTPSRSRSLLMVLLSVNNAAAGPTTPSGMTARGADTASNATSGFTIAAFTEDLLTRTATGTRTSTIASSTAYAMHALVIRPVRPSLSLTWTAPADPKVTGLTVARDSTSVASLGPTDTSWSSSSVPDGNQTYSVTSTTSSSWRASAGVATAWC
jgi:signal peptidase